MDDCSETGVHFTHRTSEHGWVRDVQDYPALIGLVEDCLRAYLQGNGIAELPGAFDGLLLVADKGLFYNGYAPLS